MPMRALPSVLGLGLLLSSEAALAGQCTVTDVDGGDLLERQPTELRRDFIRQRLHVDARHARIWSYTWGAIYSALTVGQLIPAPFVSRAAAEDLYVGAGASVLGLLPLVFTPLEVMRDDRRLEQLESGRHDADPCVSLSEMEGMLERDADNELQGRSLLFHGGNIVVNTGIFFLMGAGFGHWTDATISLVTGIAIGEIMIFTQPMGAVKALHQYRKGDLTARAERAHVAMAPWLGRGRSGATLVVLF